MKKIYLMIFMFIIALGSIDVLTSTEPSVVSLSYIGFGGIGAIFTSIFKDDED